MTATDQQPLAVLVNNLQLVAEKARAAITLEENAEGKTLRLAADAAGTEIILVKEEIARLQNLTIEVLARGTRVFIPLTGAAGPLKITVNIAAGGETGIYLNAEAAAREITTIFELAKNSSLSFFSLLTDSNAQLACDATIYEGAEAVFTGLTRTAGEAKTRIEVNVHHVEGSGRTQQRFYSYARDNSAISFTGRIEVEPGAGGTEAHQLHRGVTLSHGARIDAQPFLNIRHDDVRCTHGSTVGFIDEDALAYLMARGLTREHAETMLIHSSERQFFDALPQGAARDFYSFREHEL